MVTQNTDYALGTSYQLAIKRIPGVAFFSTSVSLPSVSLNNPTQGSRYKEIFVADSVLRLEPLRVTFIIDRDFLNYNSILAWMLALGRTDDTMYQNFLQQHNVTGLANESIDSTDGSLLVYSTDNAPIVEILYHGLLPASLSINEGVKSTSTQGNYLTANLTMNYNWFEVTPLS
jgi:hypothetical protein